MNYSLVASLLHKPWAIDNEFAEAHGFLVYNLLAGVEMDMEVEKEPICSIVASTGDMIKGLDSFKDAPKGSIAIIGISGSLMKNDNECAYGMASMGNAIKEADRNENIISMILVIDSPGGTVDGTQALSSVILNTTKPVVAFVDGLMASAALWVGTSADYVIAINSTTQIGSIGTMISFADMQPVWEKMGVKFHKINADQSVDKNKIFTDALKGDYKGIQDQLLNPMTEEFINAVKANRPQTDASKENVFTGKVYLAQDALKFGLIDEIGGFEMAVEKATALASAKDFKKNKETANSAVHADKPKQEVVADETEDLSAATIQENELINSSLNTKIDMSKLALLCAVMGVADLEATKDGVFLSQEQLEKAEAALKMAADMKAAKAKADEDLAAAKVTISELEAAKADMSKKGADDSSKIISKTETEKGKGSITVTSEDNDFMANMNAVAEKYM